MSPLPLEPGGFLHPTWLSPTDPSTNPRSADPILPQPRSTPLQSGSARESTFINYVDQKLLDISRRYQKKFEASYEDQTSPEPEGRGYEEFGELARDVQALTDVVWVSGTRWFDDQKTYRFLCLLWRSSNATSTLFSYYRTCPELVHVFILVRSAIDVQFT